VAVGDFATLNLRVETAQAAAKSAAAERGAAEQEERGASEGLPAAAGQAAAAQGGGGNVSGASDVAPGVDAAALVSEAGGGGGGDGGGGGVFSTLGGLISDIASKVRLRAGARGSGGAATDRPPIPHLNMALLGSKQARALAHQPRLHLTFPCHAARSTSAPALRSWWAAAAPLRPR
jgi:hypothetical protein